MAMRSQTRVINVNSTYSQLNRILMQKESDAVQEPSYTVYLRFPFPRNGFQEPHQTSWNSKKERELWSILSRANKRAEVKCTRFFAVDVANVLGPQLAERFNVSVSFLLQQSAYLYERQLQHVREEMQRVTIQSVSLSDRPASRSASVTDPGASRTLRTYDDEPERTLTLDAPDRNARRPSTHSQSDDSASSTSSADTADRQFVPLFSEEPQPRASSAARYHRSSFQPRQQTPTNPATQLSPTVDPRQGSTGSSFSDISDSSISRSALEEALLSDMKHGSGVSARMSNISSAIKSKYFER